MRVRRFEHNPIVGPAASATIGTNINGPSLIRVPDWVTTPLGRYYLYFAHHKGTHIRLAFSDTLEGPWRVHEPGALALEDSAYPVELDVEGIAARLAAATGRVTREFLYAHIASPEAVVVPERQQIRLYYHGMLETGRQASRVATSTDGLHFTPLPDVIANPYLRMFKRPDAWYGMAMPGVFYRSADGLTGFEQGPTLFDRNMRHAALAVSGATLQVFWTRVGDSPEHILLTAVDTSGDWQDWRCGETVDVLLPEFAWEGADLPLVPSVRGAIEAPANQLRDPCYFEERGQSYLLYSVAGESGIAIASVDFQGG